MLDVYDSVAYLHDGTADGVLSAIFQSYAVHEDPQEVVREQDYQPQLMQRASIIKTDAIHAQRVARGIERTLGAYAKRSVLHATLSGDKQAGTIIYRFVRHAMAHPSKRPLDDLAHPAVKALHDMLRALYNECEHIRQFARFEHLGGNEIEVWFAKVNPKDAVVPLVMDHFVDRFSIQPFILYDEVSQMAGVWDGKQVQFVDAAHLGLMLPDITADEAVMQEAWRTFYRTVAIDARYNPELRQRFMPKRFWSNLTEMKPCLDGLARKG